MGGERVAYQLQWWEEISSKWRQSRGQKWDISAKNDGTGNAS